MAKRMIDLHVICDFLDQLAPTRLAEDWDNVGLLVGDKNLGVDRIMTCLTITPETADEAIDGNIDLIVSHHPLPFKPIKKLTTESTATKILWDLIRCGIAIYSPHTGFDSAGSGINQMICRRVGMTNIAPLLPFVDDADGLGSGRFGQLESPTNLSSFIETLKKQFAVDQIQFVGNLKSNVTKVASACGSGGSFIDHVVRESCDTFITGEASFHTCLEAKARCVSLVLLGHYASERFAIENLSDALHAEFPDIKVWPSSQESDPVQWA